jgi:hypothetical protein
MALLKRKRQRLTIKITRILGIEIAAARRVARHIIDYKGGRDEIFAELDRALGPSEFHKGCECCGDSTHTWKGKRGSLTYKYGSFTLGE